MPNPATAPQRYADNLPPLGSKVVGVRYQGNAPALIEKAAADAGLTVSEYVRDLTLPDAIERAADRILDVHRRKLIQPLRNYFRAELLRELKAGTPEGATSTEAALAALQEQDPDTWIDDRAKVLLDKRPELRDLSNTDPAKAFKKALKLAAAELRGDTDGLAK